MNKTRKMMVRCGTGLTAIIFIIYGSFRGETEVVLNKAINICLECIGLG